MTNKTFTATPLLSMQNTVQEFVEALDQAEENPYACVYVALLNLQFDEDLAKAVPRQKLAKYEAAFLRATNRVILDPYDHDDAPRGGRKTFHIKWIAVQPIAADDRDEEFVLHHGQEDTEGYDVVHLRLHVDGCRYRFHKCTDCHSLRGLGPALSHDKFQAVRMMLFETYAVDAMIQAMRCIRSVIASDTRLVSGLKFPAADPDFSYNVINHEIAADAFSACVLPFLWRVKEAGIECILESPVTGAERTGTVKAITIRREQQDVPPNFDNTLPRYMRAEFELTYIWYFVVHWADEDLEETWSMVFNEAVAVHDKSGNDLGDTSVYDILQNFMLAPPARRQVSMAQLETKMDAIEDVMDAEEQKQHAIANARAYHKRQQKEAMHRGEAYDPMQWDALGKEDEEEDKRDDE